MTVSLKMPAQLSFVKMTKKMLQLFRQEEGKKIEKQYHHYETVIIGISPTPGGLQMVVC